MERLGRFASHGAFGVTIDPAFSFPQIGYGIIEKALQRAVAAIPKGPRNARDYIVKGVYVRRFKPGESTRESIGAPKPFFASCHDRVPFSFVVVESGLSDNWPRLHHSSPGVPA